MSALPQSGAARLVALEEGAWRARTLSFRDHGYTQLWPYSRALAARHGARSEHWEVRRGESSRALVEVRVKSIPALGTGLAYVGGAPLVRQGEVADGTALEEALVSLRRHYVEERHLALRLRLPIGPPAWAEEADASLRSLGFRSAEGERFYRTLLVDLGPDEETLRAGLAKRWRRALNQSLRQPLTIDVGSEVERFDLFASLYGEMIERKRFDSPLGPDFYRAVQAELPESERFEVWFARLDGKPVGGVVTSSLGDVCVYVLGASGAAAHETRASFRLHWEVLARARARGLAWYDLGGYDPEGNPGVGTFKEGLGGVDVRAPGPYELLPGALRGRLLRTAEGLYRRLRHGRTQPT